MVACTQYTEMWEVVLQKIDSILMELGLIQHLLKI